MSSTDSLSQFNLTHRAALITGAGTGIGQASAILLAQAGATIAVHYHSSKAGAEKTLAEIERQTVQLHDDMPIKDNPEIP